MESPLVFHFQALGFLQKVLYTLPDSGFQEVSPQLLIGTSRRVPAVFPQPTGAAVVLMPVGFTVYRLVGCRHTGKGVPALPAFHHAL
jgi:hypothetical protein